MFVNQFTFLLLLQSHRIFSQKNKGDKNVQMQVRAVFMNCQVNENDNAFPQHENTRYAQEELFRHGSLTNCKKKIALTIKMSGEDDGNFGDEYIPIEHVINGPNNRRTRLLNPYVLRLRRESPLQAYNLRRIDTVRTVLTNPDYQEEDSSNIKRQTHVDMNLYQNDNIENVEPFGGQELNKIQKNVPNSVTKRVFLNDSFKNRFKRNGNSNDEKNHYDDKSQWIVTDSLISEINNFQQPDNENDNKIYGKKHDYSFSNEHVIKRRQRVKSLKHRSSDTDTTGKKSLLLQDNELDTDFNSKFRDNIINNFTINSDLENGGSQTEAIPKINPIEKAYALYEIGNPDLWSTVHVQLFEKLIAPNGQIVWNDLTKGDSASVSSFLPDWGNPDITIRYQNTEWVAREDFILPTTGFCLLTPLNEFDRDNPIDNIRFVNNQQYFVLPMDAVINIKDTNNHIKRYSNESSSSTDNISKHFCRRVQIRLSRALFTGPNKTMRIASRGTDRFLTLPYRRSCHGQIDLEARADENQLVAIGSAGRITTAVSDCTRPTSITLSIQATNNGLAAARFRAVVRECRPSLMHEFDKQSEELITNHILIPPKHTRLLQLQVLTEIPVDSSHCSVALMNDYDEEVAVRDVTLKKGDRCFCVWHCDCVCLSEDPKLLCREMPVSRQIAAGLSSYNQRRHARSVCYNDIVTIDMFVTVIGVISALLLLGLLKAFIGLFIPTVRNWGLDRVLQTPRKVNHYYECSLSSRTVVYDADGWPVHPDTKQRTVHLVSRPMEFILNTIFFIVTPCLSVRNAIKTIINRWKGEEKATAAKTFFTNKETKKCFSSHDMQSVEPLWRRRRGGLRRWMTPQAEKLSTDIWRKALPSQQSIKCEFMRPLLHEQRYRNDQIVKGQDSCADSDQEDTEYVLMQMQKSKESLKRSQRKLNDSECYQGRSDSKSKDLPSGKNN